MGAMWFDNFFNDGQAESASDIWRTRNGIEAFKHLIPMFVGNTRATIINFQEGFLPKN